MKPAPAFVRFANAEAEHEARQRRPHMRHKWEHALLNATPMARVELNARRAEYALTAVHPPRRPAWLTTASAALGLGRLERWSCVRRSWRFGGARFWSSTCVALLVASICVAARGYEHAWAVRNGHPGGARIGSLHGRDRPGNDLSAALIEEMIAARRLRQRHD